MANQLLIIWHSRTGASKQMARAVYEGAGEESRLLTAEQVRPDDILGASGYAFVCPENLATMSGMMKEMFDRCYYPVLGRIEGRAYATAIAAGSDGEGAERQIDRIAKGWRLKRVADPIIVSTSAQTPEEILARKTIAARDLEQCRELGEALQSGLSLGVF